MPEIWDVHCHLASPLKEATPEARLGRLLEVADRMGISRLCVYMGMKWSYDPSPDDFRKQNNQVLAAIARYPDRALGFVYINPKHPRESLDEINRCIADGPMVGVKLWVAAHADTPQLDPLDLDDHAAPRHRHAPRTGHVPDLGARQRRHRGAPAQR